MIRVLVVAHDAESVMSEQISLYSIGYGNVEIETMLGRLRDLGIAYLIDVRTRPISRFRPEFNQAPLRLAAKEAGLIYVYMGDDLGGMPSSSAAYDDEGHADYSEMSKMPGFVAALDRLENIHKKDLKAALLCSEGRPEMCHRSKLIGVELEKRSVPIVHIDPDGMLVSQSQAMLRLTNGQMGLELAGNLSGQRSRKSYRDRDSEQ